MTPDAILAILSLVEQLLPQLPNLANSAPLVEQIITVLEKWLPIVLKLMPNATTVFSAISGIIDSVRGNTDIPTQLDRLDQIQAIADTAFEAAAAKIEAKLPPEPST